MSHHLQTFPRILVVHAYYENADAEVRENLRFWRSQWSGIENPDRDANVVTVLVVSGEHTVSLPTALRSLWIIQRSNNSCFDIGMYKH